MSLLQHLLILAIVASSAFGQGTPRPAAHDRLATLLATLRSATASESARLAALNEVRSCFLRPDGDAPTRKEILEAILGLLAADTPDDLSIGGLEALGAFRLPRTLRLLALAFDAAHDRAVAVRVAAVEAAAQVGGVAAIPTLVHALGDRDAAVVDEAGRWLQRICWTPADDMYPQERWRGFFSTDDGQKLLIASFARLRGSVGTIPKGVMNGIPAHVVALVLDDDLGEAAWREAYRYLVECVAAHPGADPEANRREATSAVRARWPSVRPPVRGAVEHDHATAQFARMLADRPAMSLCLKQGDELRTWAVSQFGGVALGFPVYWNPEAPPDGFEADHRGPTGMTTAFIRIRPIVGETSEISCERYWRSLVYEMNNLKNAPAYLALHDAALRGDIDRHEWIGEVTALEFRAVKELREYYFDSWKPWVTKWGLQATPAIWFVGAGETYEEWIAKCSRSGGYPEVPFGRYYDETIVPRRVGGWTKERGMAADRAGEGVGQVLAVIESPVLAMEERVRALDECAAIVVRPDVDTVTRVRIIHRLASVVWEAPTDGVGKAAYVKLVEIGTASSSAVAAESRVAAVEVVAVIGGVAAIPTLVHALGDSDATVTDAARRWLERICWAAVDGRGAATSWRGFLRTGEGEKMLVAAFTKLRCAIGSPKEHERTGLPAQVVTFVLDEEVGSAGWLEAYRCLVQCVGEHFVEDPVQDRTAATRAVREWWSSK